MNEFIPIMVVLVALVVALIALIMILNEREMDRLELPVSRKIEKARMMSEEYRK